MDQGIAILITAFVAVVSIFLTGALNRRLTRKQHTYRVLEKMNPWKRFDKAISKASKLINSGSMPDINCDADEKHCDNLDFILNHYEFISAAIVCGDVDESLVRSVEEGRMRRIYLKFLPYIQKNRDARQDKRMWEHLEYLTYRWNVEKSDSYDRFVELLCGHPTMNNFHFERPKVSDALKKLAQEIT